MTVKIIIIYFPVRFACVMETYCAFCKAGKNSSITWTQKSVCIRNVLRPASMYPKRPTTGHLDTGFPSLISYIFRFLSLNLFSSKCRQTVPDFKVYYQKVNIVGPKASLDIAEKRNLPSLPEFKSLTVQHVATRYIDCPISAP